jgi:hypothetical protein
MKLTPATAPLMAPGSAEGRSVKRLMVTPVDGSR